jgi:hypothetical protein
MLFCIHVLLITCQGHTFMWSTIATCMHPTVPTSEQSLNRFLFIYTPFSLFLLLTLGNQPMLALKLWIYHNTLAFHCHNLPHNSCSFYSHESSIFLCLPVLSNHWAPDHSPALNDLTTEILPIFSSRCSPMPPHHIQKSLQEESQCSQNVIHHGCYPVSIHIMCTWLNYVMRSIWCTNHFTSCA